MLSNEIFFNQHRQSLKRTSRFARERNLLKKFDFIQKIWKGVQRGGERGLTINLKKSVTYYSNAFIKMSLIQQQQQRIKFNFTLFRPQTFSLLFCWQMANFPANASIYRFPFPFPFPFSHFYPTEGKKQ